MLDVSVRGVGGTVTINSRESDWPAGQPSQLNVVISSVEVDVLLLA